MSPTQQAKQKLSNALRAYHGAKWKLPDGKTKWMNPPQKTAWDRVERWAFRCKQLGISIPKLEP